MGLDIDNPFNIVVGLIAILLFAAVFAGVMQQIKKRQEDSTRDEIIKVRGIISEVTQLISVCSQLPITPQMHSILQKRLLNNLKRLMELTSPTADLQEKAINASQTIKSIDVTESGQDLDRFNLPRNDKKIINIIQTIKKFRVALRQEYAKGNISQKVFQAEDKFMINFQLRVNVESLIKRAMEADAQNMSGSAEQYYDRAIIALLKHKPQDSYTRGKIKELQDTLSARGKSSSADKQRGGSVDNSDYMKKKREQQAEIDELFAPKKKTW